MAAEDDNTGWIEREAAGHATTLTSAAIHANRVSTEDAPGFFAKMFQAAAAAIRGQGTADTPAPEEVVKLTAAQVRKSITPDALISFIDNKPYKTLKRHLRVHGMTVEGYRAKFGLPDDYPSTAASYSAQRSALAKSLGLGRGGERSEGGDPPNA